MISKRSLLLILYLAITGCTMDCVEPGLQSRNTSVSVDVPVRKADEGIKIHWVDSGQVISRGEEIKFTLGGSVNFCPFKEGKNPRKVLVPASFCVDGSEPEYKRAANINNVPNNYGIDETGIDGNELCNGKGFGSNRRYVDTGIKVNPGDKLSFSLVSRKITIGCNELDALKGKVIFNDDYYKSGGSKATAEEICKGGKFFYKDDKDAEHKIELKPLDKRKDKDGKEHDQKYRVLVGNGYTPYDNKVHFNVQNESPWMNGALLDLRRAKIGLNKLCDGKDCDSNKIQKQGSTKMRLDKLCEGKKCDPNEIKKYSSYELNCYYQNMCYTKKGVDFNGNCVSSVRYKNYGKDKCDMYSYLKEVEDKLQPKKIEENKDSTTTSDTEESTKDISWAEALVAKIGDLDDQDTAQGVQCLPKRKEANDDLVCSKISDNFKDFSLKLNHDYKVNKKVESGSNVMLAIASNGNYFLHKGGYHVKVTRLCEYTDGEKLYIYLGNELPKDLSGVGTNDFKVVGVKNGEGKHTILDVISGEHLQNGESKKIYFGIDVSNVEREDITDKEGKYYENNKYSINLFVRKEINNFISSTINKIFGFITTGGEDGIKIPYEGYRKGLLQGVRALLTLYVIFTVVGYMLGTIQLSKFDFIVRMMKIAFIACAFSDRSWELFGITLSKLFVGGSTYLVDSFSGYVGEEGEKFAFLDLTAGVLFTGETWLKFLSLMFAGPFGFIAFLIILKATFTFLKCIISATFKYVISTVLVAFLLSLTPLFVAFILFQQTKSLFDNWIKTLAHVSLQPMILFSSLSVLNQLMYSVLYNLTNFSACYQCLISIKFLLHDFCLMKSILPLGYSPGTSVDVALSTGERAGGHFAALPIDLIQAVIYFIIAKAMEAFVSVSEAMAQAILGAGFGIMSGVNTVAGSASQSILSTVGLDDDTQSMIKSIKQKMSKDRVGVDAKLLGTPKRADKKEDPEASPDETKGDSKAKKKEEG